MSNKKHTEVLIGLHNKKKSIENKLTQIRRLIVKAREDPQRLDASYQEGFIVRPSPPDPLYVDGDRKLGFTPLGIEKLTVIFNLFCVKGEDGTNVMSFNSFWDYLRAFPRANIRYDLSIAKEKFLILKGGEGEYINFDQFKNYVESIQIDFPIKKDLNYIGKDILPSLSDEQTQINRVKKLFGNAESESANIQHLQEISYLLNFNLTSLQVREICMLLSIKDMQISSIERFANYVLIQKQLPPIVKDEDDDEGDSKGRTDVIKSFATLKMAALGFIRGVKNNLVYVASCLPKARELGSFRGASSISNDADASSASFLYSIGSLVNEEDARTSASIVYEKNIDIIVQEKENKKDKKAIVIEANPPTITTAFLDANPPNDCKSFIRIDFSIDDRVQDRILNKEILPLAERFIFEELEIIFKTIPGYLCNKVSSIFNPLGDKFLRLEIFTSIDFEKPFEEAGLEPLFKTLSQFTLKLSSSLPPSAFLFELNDDSLDHLFSFTSKLDVKGNIPSIARLIEAMQLPFNYFKGRNEFFRDIFTNAYHALSRSKDINFNWHYNSLSNFLFFSPYSTEHIEKEELEMRKNLVIKWREAGVLYKSWRKILSRSISDYLVRGRGGGADPDERRFIKMYLIFAKQFKGIKIISLTTPNSTLKCEFKDFDVCVLLPDGSS